MSKFWATRNRLRKGKTQNYFFIVVEMALSALTVFALLVCRRLEVRRRKLESHVCLAHQQKSCQAHSLDEFLNDDGDMRWRDLVNILCSLIITFQIGLLSMSAFLVLPNCLDSFLTSFVNEIIDHKEIELL